MQKANTANVVPCDSILPVTCYLRGLSSGPDGMAPVKNNRRAAEDSLLQKGTKVEVKPVPNQVRIWKHFHS